MRSPIHNEVEPLTQQVHPDGQVNMRLYDQGSRTYHSPGHQVVVSVQGCPQRCSGCCIAEEFLDTSRVRDLITPDRLASCIAMSFGNVLHNQDERHMLVLVGGEPFAQAGPLAQAIEIAREKVDGIGVMAFTGYPLADLQRIAAEEGQPEIMSLLAQTDLLLAGPYDRERRDINHLTGSTNQETLHLTDRLSHVSGQNFGRTESFAVAPDGGVSKSITGFAV